METGNNKIHESINRNLHVQFVGCLNFDKVLSRQTVGLKFYFELDGSLNLF